MKNLRNFLLVFVAMAVSFVAGNNVRPVEIEARAQATSAKSDWITRQRAATNLLITACQTVKVNDNEYVANNYGASLVNGDFTGANSGILATDMTTAEANLVKIADATLGTAASFPVSIATGTNSTIFKIK